MITSISQTLVSSTSNAASPAKAAAAAVQGDAAAGSRAASASASVVDDPSLGSAVSLSSDFKDATIPSYGVVQITQQTAAGESMNTMTSELEKIDAMVARRRPEIAGQWDFKLVDGKFKVTGLKADDAKWLEKKLNSNTALLGAAKAFTAAAVDNLQTSKTNPASSSFNYVTGSMQNRTFYDVEAQLSEKLSFRAMLTQSAQVFDVENLSANMRGIAGFSAAASVLTSSNNPVEGASGSFYTAKYDPMQS